MNSTASMSEEKQGVTSIVAADETVGSGEKPVDTDELRLAQMGIHLCCQGNCKAIEANYHPQRPQTRIGASLWHFQPDWPRVNDHHLLDRYVNYLTCLRTT